MKTIFINLILLFSFLFNLSIAQAEELAGQKTNGCGTEGIQGILVPDSTLLSKCQFHNACNTHDLCYGKCLKGGNLFGKETCNDSIAKEARRSTCDANFFNDIVEENDEREICKFYGKIYRLAVVKFGKGNFNGKEIEEMAAMAFEQGPIKAEQFYNNLSEIQSIYISPQTLMFNHDSKSLILKQNQNEFRFNQQQLNEMANKHLQRNSLPLAR